jgi:HD-GYP domain-containing protein (c-di-GMP phosphodiesterase class II)
MKTIQLLDDDLVIGTSLHWPVYNEDGELLLKKGYVLQSTRQKQVLLAKGVYRLKATENENAATDQLIQKQAPKKLHSPIAILNAVKKNLSRILNDMTQGTEDDYIHRVFRLSAVIQKLCYENADAALGALLLDQDALYTQVHPILCALLTDLMGKRQQIPSEDRLPMIAASLTQNIGMLELQEELSRHSGPLTDQQRKIINNHPHKSLEIMQSLGIDNNTWLQTVLSHHERPDGKGYPQGLYGDSIPEASRLLSLTDIYSAMVLPRRFRDGIHVKRALREIFLHRGELVDAHLAQLLIKEIGVYPPGSFVKLINGDTAVVIRRGIKHANSPMVLSILTPRGAPYKNPPLRDTKIDQLFEIEKVVPRDKNIQLDLYQLWG